VEKKQFAKDLKVKDNVESIFLVKHIAMMEGRDGRSYLNLILSDMTGDLEARKWNEAENTAESITRGDYVFIKGKMNSFQGRQQLIVQEICTALPEKINPADYVAKSKKEADKLYQEITEIVESLDDVYIRDLLKNIMFDIEIERRIKMWPAGKSIHHAYQGGLLEHLHSCVKLGSTLSKHYGVNRNFVVAGCLLHDICKIYELTDGNLTDYTEEGKLIGHLVKGIELLDWAAGKISHFPSGTRLHLKHILISHHGNSEYGSPKPPQTSEANLVHLIDLMDSQMASFDAAKLSDNMSGNWTSYIKHLDRIIYKVELPHYDKYLTTPEVVTSVSPSHPVELAPKVLKDTGPLKQSLADKLKNLKIE